MYYVSVNKANHLLILTRVAVYCENRINYKYTLGPKLIENLC
jgi:hypothetical protein